MTNKSEVYKNCTVEWKQCVSIRYPGGNKVAKHAMGCTVEVCGETAVVTFKDGTALKVCGKKAARTFSDGETIKMSIESFEFTPEDSSSWPAPEEGGRK